MALSMHVDSASLSHSCADAVEPADVEFPMLDPPHDYRQLAGGGNNHE